MVKKVQCPLCIIFNIFFDQWSEQRCGIPLAIWFSTYCWTHDCFNDSNSFNVASLGRVLTHLKVEIWPVVLCCQTTGSVDNMPPLEKMVILSNIILTLNDLLTGNFSQ